MRSVVQVVVAFIGVALLWEGEAQAIAPRYVADDELATYPIIVVAKWDKAPAKSHNKYAEDKDLGEVVLKSEVYTRLNILAAVKGGIEPGEHELLMNWGITWQEDGTYVNSGTSSEMSGDVNHKRHWWRLTDAGLKLVRSDTDLQERARRRLQ